MSCRFAGKGVIEDEHGNRFKPLDLRGWSCLPSNNTLGGGWDGDSGSRIHPGETYRNALYHEYAPPTSHQVVITLPLDGRTLRFRGLIGGKEKLDHERALKAKAGMVLEAGDLIRAIRDGSKDVKIETKQVGNVVLEMKNDVWYCTASVDCTITVPGRVYMLKASEYKKIPLDTIKKT